jgi:outer membrane receptor for Fe3+-dicitrate
MGSGKGPRLYVKGRFWLIRMSRSFANRRNGMSKLANVKMGKFLALVLFLFMAGSFDAIEAQDELEQIDVRGKVRREELQSTSATILDNKDISDRHYVTPADILKLSPGISIRQGNIFQSSNSIKIRGFSGAHDYGGQVLMTVDGIPSTTAATPTATSTPT